MMTIQPWEQQAQKARDILNNSIPKQWLVPEEKLPPVTPKNVLDFPRQSGLLSEEELRITELSATELVAEMGAGKLKAEQTVVAFLKRSVMGQQLLNFATEFLAEEAVARAKELDEYFQRTGKLVGPLHGVPISVKEHVGMKGRACNTGYVAWVDNISPDDAFLLQFLAKAGAVFHVRTNQPQALMHLCCSNNITGTTLNPHNRTLTPGGSSGGEGASISFRCSPLGIGTDVGGSIRGPAAFCGGYGFKPTSMRNPMPGIQIAAIGQESIPGIVGPMGSSSLEDLELFQKDVLDQEPWEMDVSIAPLPWKTVTPTRNMTIAIMWDDGCVRPHPPITRALKLAKEKLVAAGVNVVDWEPYKHDYAWDITSALYYPDAAELQHQMLRKSGEPARPLSEWAFSYGRPEPLTHHEVWQLQFQRNVYRGEYNALVKSRGVDYILCPTYPTVAAVMGESHYWNYTAIWNVLDLPSAVFPTGLTVDPTLDALSEEDQAYKPRNETDKREWLKYQSPARYEAAPVALQITGRHFKDEETLAAARVVEDIIRDGGKFSKV